MTGSVTLSINWKLSLVGLLLLSLLLYLGVWQLQRAEEKAQLLAKVERQRALPVMSLDDSPIDPQLSRFRTVEASGSFRPGQYYLLDNRVLRGKVGYEVIAPLYMANNRRLLVNLGWLPAPPLRADLPRAELPVGRVQIDGTLVLPGNNTMIRATAPEQGWPRRIQQINIAEAAQQLEASLLPWVLQISAENKHALAVDWRAVNSSPARHTGYAMQWFAMAAALVIGLIFANTNLGEVIRKR